MSSYDSTLGKASEFLYVTLDFAYSVCETWFSLAHKNVHFEGL